MFAADEVNTSRLREGGNTHIDRRRVLQPIASATRLRQFPSWVCCLARAFAMIMMSGKLATSIPNLP